MNLEKRSMTKSYMIPKHWRRWAFSKGYSVEKIIVLSEQFKEYYAKRDLELTDLAWERRFKSWVEKQRRPVYLNDPIQNQVQEEPKPTSPFIGLQYLAQMKMMLNNASNKLNHT